MVFFERMAQKSPPIFKLTKINSPSYEEKQKKHKRTV